MPSTPTAIKYAPRPPRFTCAVAGDLTIWALPAFETADPPGRASRRDQRSRLPARAEKSKSPRRQGKSIGSLLTPQTLRKRQAGVGCSRGLTSFERHGRSDEEVAIVVARATLEAIEPTRWKW